MTETAFSGAGLPTVHPLRQTLNDEVHSRPTEALWRQERVFHMAMVGTPETLAGWSAHLQGLVARLGAAVSPALNWQAPQVSLPLTAEGGEDSISLRARFERHNEFVSFTLFERADNATPFDRSAAHRLPPGWLSEAPGQLLVAVDLFEWDCAAPQRPEDVASFFERHTLVGGYLASGAGQVFTDFEINPRNGASRILVCNQSMGSRQAGRMVQRLLEIETYRMMALLSFPVAKSAIPRLAQSERDLVRITNDLATRTDEAQLRQAAGDALALDATLLSQLTQLAAQVEDLSAATRVRFTAAAAYHDLVDKRIAELREGRLDGVQTWNEFMERRLGPAIRTCAWTARRQGELSERIARITQLLRTRVEIEREAQNQRLLASMDERARAQLRLQETVEGLSVVAITYYGVGLVAYLAKSLKVVGLPINPDYAVALAIPLIGVATWRAVRAIRRHLVNRDKADPVG